MPVPVCLNSLLEDISTHSRGQEEVLYSSCGVGLTVVCEDLRNRDVIPMLGTGRATGFFFQPLYTENGDIRRVEDGNDTRGAGWFRAHSFIAVRWSVERKDGTSVMPLDIDQGAQVFITFRWLDIRGAPRVRGSGLSR
jgi:hypothetical protein